MDAPGDGEDDGFTLIELMVVLLIMAVLLAIAIPTFLAVTAGAERTAAQSDLTNVLQSATALFARDQMFPQSTTPTAATAQLDTAIKSTQQTITFVSGITPPKAGDNVVSVFTAGTGKLAYFSAIDTNGGCWFVATNQSNTTVNGVPPGNWFFGLTGTAIHSRCPAGLIYDPHTTIHTTWKPNFRTVSGVQ